MVMVVMVVLPVKGVLLPLLTVNNGRSFQCLWLSVSEASSSTTSTADKCERVRETVGDFSRFPEKSESERPLQPLI